MVFELSDIGTNKTVEEGAGSPILYKSPACSTGGMRDGLGILPILSMTSSIVLRAISPLEQQSPAQVRCIVDQLLRHCLGRERSPSPLTKRRILGVHLSKGISYFSNMTALCISYRYDGLKMSVADSCSWWMTSTT